MQATKDALETKPARHAWPVTIDVSALVQAAKDAIDAIESMAAVENLGILPEALSHPRGREQALEREVRQLREREQTLESQLESLRDRVQVMEQRLADEVVVVREVSEDDAKTELLAYFREHPDAYPSDAAMALRLDSAWVRDLCDTLVGEGFLEE